MEKSYADLKKRTAAAFPVVVQVLEFKVQWQFQQQESLDHSDAEWKPNKEENIDMKIFHGCSLQAVLQILMLQSKD
ncbi:hypothetical protein SADUNF_Sadunf03G0022500 [Salix dunnii]|uniref:Uncharacterized protein n=1 Tax=Salix dunnii TaxID=1413687 RepID=A0A835N365_9ROSI|nr:hypothetical protein SADUNF_Sadunf03G0022500 [Salix dunnii]